ncbi:MAG: hypothetical protein ACFFD1_04160 [Candidatus Thorarchaeota archaeon]
MALITKSNQNLELKNENSSNIIIKLLSLIKSTLGKAKKLGSYFVQLVFNHERDLKNNQGRKKYLSYQNAVQTNASRNLYQFNR